MKKAGILTFFRSINHGAVLQAYALTTVVEKKFGYSAELIDFRSPRVEYYRKWFRPGEYVQLIKQPLRLVKRIGAEIVYAIANIRRTKNFDSFIRMYLKISPNVFLSEDDLQEKAQDYDAYIVGSDLVWNPEMAEGANAVYFHSYVKDSHKLKISYAASIGLTALPDDVLRNYAEWLKNLDYIAVREKSAEKLLQPISDNEVNTVLDPTLLTTEEDWIDILSQKKCVSQRYILSFMLEYSPLLIETVKKIADEKGLPIVSFDLRNYYKGRTVKKVWDAGPAEFLSLVYNADCVVTNSFHGSAFSLLFHRELWCIPHTTRGTRMTELLSKLGLEDRIVSEKAGYTASQIDYTDVDTKLDALKQNSMRYLSRSLEGRK